MSAGVRMPLMDAIRVADGLVALLAPACERIEVAGSIRRHKPDVGDVEIVAIPRMRHEPAGLWGETYEVSTLWELINRMDDKPLQRQSGGDRYQKLLDVPSGLQLDLFVTTPEQWGLIFLIRTGPADYSQWFVTEARRRGMHSCGGWLRRGLASHDETTYHDCGLEKIPTPEERDAFTALGMPFVDLWDRHVPWERHA